MPRFVASITFPPVDPTVFRVGPLAVQWYGLAYLAGFVLAFLVLRVLARRGTLRVSTAALSDLVGWLVLGVLVGGRLGRWLFYHRGVVGGSEPWYEPWAIWHGSMSFHGGLAGVATVLVAWSAVKGVPFWNLADCAALVAPIGLFFGRLAELVGRPTSLPWGVVSPGETFGRHPSQLYEAVLEGPVLLAVLWCVFLLSRPREGRLAALFLISYGVFRFAVEFTRQPDEQIGFVAFGWLTMGQLLSATVAAVGVAAWFAFSVQSIEGEQPAGPTNDATQTYH